MCQWHLNVGLQDELKAFSVLRTLWSSSDLSLSMLIDFELLLKGAIT